MINFYKTNIGKQEIKATELVLKSGFLTSGKYNLKFEKAFLKKININKLKNIDCCTVSNCTSALMLSLKALGITRGDEVIIPSLTFVADASAITQLGAKPVLCDSISDLDWNISPLSVEKKITKKTKAIIIVHFAGFPCDIPAIKNISKKYNIAVIEDTCHALFSKNKNKFLGLDFDLSTFSFYGNKNFTTGEGGMVVGKKTIINKIRNLKSHNIIRENNKNNFYPGYEINEFGYNFRLTDIQAAIGIEQLKKINNFNKRRKYLYTHYVKKIKYNNLNVKIPFTDRKKDKYSYHIFPILLPKNCDRRKIITKLFYHGIETSIHYKPIHKLKAYKTNARGIKIVDSFYDRILTLPLYPSLKEKNINYIVKILKKIL